MNKKADNLKRVPFWGGEGVWVTQIPSYDDNLEVHIETLPEETAPVYYLKVEIITGKNKGIVFENDEPLYPSYNGADGMLSIKSKGRVLETDQQVQFKLVSYAQNGNLYTAEGASFPAPVSQTFEVL
jgi:hypothetical protein